MQKEGRVGELRTENKHWPPAHSQHSVGMDQNTFNAENWANFNSIFNCNTQNALESNWPSHNFDFHSCDLDVVGSDYTPWFDFNLVVDPGRDDIGEGQWGHMPALISSLEEQ
jgi:hypothetical protein